MIPWSEVGSAIGQAYFAYAWGLLLGCLGLHALLLGLYAWRGRKVPAIAVPFELLYGLLNPVVYLLVLQPALFRPLSPAWLVALSWCVLGSYWGVRLFGRLLGPKLKLIAQVVLVACGTLALAVAARDLFAQLADPDVGVNEPFRTLTPLFVAPLYVSPMVIAWFHHRALRADSPDRLLLLSSLARPAALAVTGAAAVGLLVSVVHHSGARTERLLLAHRADILEAAQSARLDPRLLASLILVTHRDHSTPFRTALEEAAAGAWLTDTYSHGLISRALDPSLGIAQIKPVTLLTGVWIHRESRGQPGFASKEYREVPWSKATWWKTPPAALKWVPVPSIGDAPGKEAVVEALLDPPRNIELCAFLLNLYATQWEAANPDWSIRARPDILATLFQIGFEKSNPKADPKPNEFGAQVREAFNSPWMFDNFSVHPAR